MGLHKNQFNAGSFRKGRTPWNKGISSLLNCLECGKKLKTYGAKYCNSCRQKGEKNHQFGKKLSIEHKEKISKKLLKNPNSYGYIHRWIRKMRGIPISCEKCGSRNNLDWCNLNYKYMKKEKDWIVLCRKCHQKFDKKNNAWGLATNNFPEIRKEIYN